MENEQVQMLEAQAENVRNELPLMAEEFNLRRQEIAARENLQRAKRKLSEPDDEVAAAEDLLEAVKIEQLKFQNRISTDRMERNRKVLEQIEQAIQQLRPGNIVVTRIKLRG